MRGERASRAAGTGSPASVLKPRAQGNGRAPGRGESAPPVPAARITWSDIAPLLTEQEAVQKPRAEPARPKRQEPKPAAGVPRERRAPPVVSRAKQAPAHTTPEPPVPKPEPSAEVFDRVAPSRSTQARARLAGLVGTRPRLRLPRLAATRPRSRGAQPVAWPQPQLARTVAGRARSLPVVPAAAVAVSLALGIGAGLLLGGSSDPESPRTTVVTGGGLGVTAPPGWHAARRGANGLTIRPERGAATGLEANLVNAQPERDPASEPVQLGSLQAWRTEAPGEVRYAAPTTAGAVLITCRAAPSDPSVLQLCERAASTLRLDNASALPVAGGVEQEERLRTTITALRTQRDAGRRRLARAETRDGQRLVARSLARSHARAAAALDPLSGSEPIAAAVRGTARAYAGLAQSAARGSERRWQLASERVERRDAVLAEALAAQG
jgi:hypothetical protein